MQSKLNLTSKLLVLVLIALLSAPTDASHHVVTVTKNDVTLNNPCSSEALSTFIPDIQYGSSLFGFEGSSTIQKICPNLKYTCCSENQLTDLVDQLRSTLNFLRYRGQIIEKLFSRIEQLADETFKVFLSELSNEDIQCYDTIQNDVLDKKLSKFTKQPDILEMIEQRRKHVLYDPRKMMSSFSYLKKMITPYIEKMNQTYANREKYFSGFVCTMCSPTFSKQFRVDKPGVPLLEINKFMCSQIIREKIEFINSLEIFPYLQKIIDIVYCTRKNSKTEKNYGEFEQKDLNLLVFDLETFPEYKKKRLECIQEDYSYFRSPDEPESCKNICQKGLGFFQIMMVSVDKFLRIENELHNMFYRFPGIAETPLERLANRTNDYYEERNKLIEKDLLNFDEKTQLETMWYIKRVPDAKLDFMNSEIDVSKFLGIHVANTPMNPTYYNWTGLLSVAAMLLMALTAF